MSAAEPKLTRRRGRSRASLLAGGEPLIWLTGGALVLSAVMVVGLVALVLWKGLSTFWPAPVVRIDTAGGTYMGEVTRTDVYTPSAAVIADVPAEIRERARQEIAGGDGETTRHLVRTGNFRLTQSHFQWVSDYEIENRSRPEWALVVERLEWGRFYGFPEAFLYVEEDGTTSRIEGAQAAWEAFVREHGAVRRRWHERRELEKHDMGAVNRLQETARLGVRHAELELARIPAEDSRGLARGRQRLESARLAHEEARRQAEQEFARIRSEIDAVNAENGRYQLEMRTAGEGATPPRTTTLRLDEIVRAYPANRLGAAAKAKVYLGRWYEFLADEPREANSEGGVFPAIFGTVAMTLIMTIAVVPFGVLAALYLREYARAGLVVSTVRVAVNNLAGVPSIVFGVFGLGFFCYVLGAGIDELFFSASLPNPTYGTGGLLWASLTLALLTLPVVIVATEEAVAAVPSSMREGSYACGASKWQTIRRIVLPRALPGIITGAILAIARGAGEVAPLMLVGAVKLAPELPIDTVFPFAHPERSFMHLGFHVYDVGFQSQNSEAAKPMVFTTTLLLITLVVTLNVAAIALRGRLRRRFAGGHF